MPAQKRSSEHLQDYSGHHNNDEEEEEEEFQATAEAEEEDGEAEDEGDGEEGEEEADAEEGEGGGGEQQGDDAAEEEDSDEDESGESNDKDEFVYVKLADIRKEVQCPICLGIIRKTRTVMECLHRFCRECIDKSMRMGNNECPACRTHCASRRSLRDDPRYDAIIAALYPDIDKYEEEELALRDEERTRNKQIQASIAQTLKRQTEALSKRRTNAKAVAQFMRRSQSQHRRGRSSRNSRANEPQSDAEEDVQGNDVGIDSSSADERPVEVRTKRCKRWGGPKLSQPPSGVANADENDDLDVSKESTSASPAFTGAPEMLAWGGGGVRSSTRYSSVSGNTKNGRAGRISKLVESLRNSEESDDKLDVHLALVPVAGQTTETLEEPYLCCRPSLSVQHLCQFVASQTLLKAEEVEILLVKEPSLNPASSGELAEDVISRVDPVKHNLQMIETHETLGELLANHTLSGGHAVLAYRQKTSI